MQDPQNNLSKVLSFALNAYFRQFLASLSTLPAHIVRSHQQPAPTSPSLCSKAGPILLQDSTGISKKKTFLRLSISLFISFEDNSWHLSMLPAKLQILPGSAAPMVTLLPILCDQFWWRTGLSHPTH